MPLYEYQCEACGRSLEVIQKYSDDPLTECSECGGKLERLLSAPAIQFKGSGWYITDYARKSNGDKAAKDAGGEKTEAKSESKADAKPESKSESGSPAKPAKSDSSSATTKAD